MGIETTSSMARLNRPGLKAVFGDNYNEREQEWTQLFDIVPSDKNYEEFMGTAWYGLAQASVEGGATPYDEAKQTYLVRITPVGYRLGFIVTHNELVDNLYIQRGVKRTKMLARSMEQTFETVAAAIYNAAFTNSGPDGVSTINSAHPLDGGGTQANRLSTDTDISEYAIEQLCTLARTMKDERGLRIKVLPRKIYIPPELEFETCRILKNTKNQPNTAERNINALATLGSIPEGYMVCTYFTDPKAFYIRTNIEEGPVCINREETVFSNDNEFDTDNLKFKAYGRKGFGVVDFRGLLGSPGA